MKTLERYQYVAFTGGDYAHKYSIVLRVMSVIIWWIILKLCPTKPEILTRYWDCVMLNWNVQKRASNSPALKNLIVCYQSWEVLSPQRSSSLFYKLFNTWYVLFYVDSLLYVRFFSRFPSFVVDFRSNLTSHRF